jgi:hypothetical protein
LNDCGISGHGGQAGHWKHAVAALTGTHPLGMF